jgi:hypothetical protein
MKPPSPERLITVRSGAATFAPRAVGNANPRVAKYEAVR